MVRYGDMEERCRSPSFSFAWSVTPHAAPSWRWIEDDDDDGESPNFRSILIDAKSEKRATSAARAGGNLLPPQSSSSFLS